MSFILEALRRADRERRAETNPGLQSVVEPPPAAPARRRSPWLAAAGIVVLGAGAAGLVLWSQGEQQTPRSVATAQPSAPGPAASMPPPLPVPTAGPPTLMVPGLRPGLTSPRADKPPAVSQPARTLESTHYPAGGSLIAAVQRRQSQPQPTPGTPSADGVAPPPPAVTRTEAPLPATRKPAPAPAAALEPEPAPPPAPTTVAATPSPRREGTAPGTPSPAAPPAPVAVEPPPPLPTEVPLLEALPPAQRQLFDGIQLDAHVYADDPEKRFVLIHMRGHRVGDTVGNAGPVIEAITRDGAILRSGSVRALIPHP